jgi:hypothetical protein
VNLLAPWHTLLLARLFGRKFVREDSGYRLTGYHWRGRIYITGWDGPQSDKKGDA